MIAQASHFLIKMANDIGSVKSKQDLPPNGSLEVETKVKGSNTFSPMRRKLYVP